MKLKKQSITGTGKKPEKSDIISLPVLMSLMVLSLCFLTGCGSGSGASQNSADTTTNTAGNITSAEAETIALEAAGVTADSVTGLSTIYEIDDNVPQYEVDFYMDKTEYDYTIHAQTGEILEFDTDNPND